MMLAWQKKWSKIAKVWDARFSRDGDAARPGAGEASWQARLLAPDSVEMAPNFGVYMSCYGS